MAALRQRRFVSADDQLALVLAWRIFEAFGATLDDPGEQRATRRY